MVFWREIFFNIIKAFPFPVRVFVYVVIIVYSKISFSITFIVFVSVSNNFKMYFSLYSSLSRNVIKRERKENKRKANQGCTSGIRWRRRPHEASAGTEFPLTPQREPKKPLNKTFYNSQK